MSRRYELDLRPLLELRCRIVAEKRAHFEGCRSACEESIRRIERCHGAVRVQIAALAAGAGLVPVGELGLRDAYITAMTAAITRERARSDQRHALAVAARDAFIVARRECRVVEKLLERRRSAQKAEMARREELELDEANARSRGRAAR